MAAIRRIIVNWNGLAGLPGVSVFYSLDSVTGQLAALRTFFDSLKLAFPAPLQWSFPGSGDVLDSATGTLTGGWTDTTPSSVTATGSGQHASGVGMFVKWNTAAIVGGRRLKGRTFLCPLGSGQYESTGN